MDIGRRVMVVSTDEAYDSDRPFPVIGSRGTVVAEIDEEDEYEVLFDDYPCLDKDPAWFVHMSMIIFFSEKPLM